MMRAFLLITFVLSSILFAHSQTKSTEAFTISGKVASQVTFKFADIKKLPQQVIGDVVITNHKGEPKGTAKGLKGVSLRALLSEVKLDQDNPKLFSEYYFICTATDGYKVVFSWNELFNTAIGNTVYVVVEKEGKSLSDHQDNILLISAKDENTGRRYVKNLQSIVVGRAE